MASDRATQVDELYRQGSEAFRAARYADASQCAERAIALEPDLAALHFLLGSARLELNDLAAADAAFSACLALRPKYPMVLYAQARGAIARARAGARNEKRAHHSPQHGAESNPVLR